MYLCLRISLVSILVTLEGSLLFVLRICLLFAYYWLTNCLLIADCLLTVLLPPLVIDYICITHILYRPLCGLSYK